LEALAMKVIYDPETDTLSVHLSDATVADSDESRPGMILDFDAEGHIVALEILDASRHMTVPPTVDVKIGARAAG
jgi:uncharacterized protein YuzE